MNRDDIDVELPPDMPDELRELMRAEVMRVHALLEQSRCRYARTRQRQLVCQWGSALACAWLLADFFAAEDWRHAAVAAMALLFAAEWRVLPKDPRDVLFMQR